MGTMPVRSSNSKAAVNPAGPAPMMIAVSAIYLHFAIAAAGIHPGVHVVDDPVDRANVNALDHAHVVQRHVDARVGHLLELAAVEAGHAEGREPMAVGPIDGGQDIGTVARSADRHQQVSRLAEIHQLLHENLVVAAVVADCRQPADVVREAQHPQTPPRLVAQVFLAEAAFAKILAKVRRRAGRTAVADDKYRVSILPGGIEQLGQVADFRRIDPGKFALQAIEVGWIIERDSEHFNSCKAWFIRPLSRIADFGRRVEKSLRGHGRPSLQPCDIDLRASHAETNFRKVRQATFSGLGRPTVRPPAMVECSRLWPKWPKKTFLSILSVILYHLWWRMISPMDVVGIAETAGKTPFYTPWSIGRSQKGQRRFDPFRWVSAHFWPTFDPFDPLQPIFTPRVVIFNKFIRSLEERPGRLSQKIPFLVCIASRTKMRVRPQGEGWGNTNLCYWALMFVILVIIFPSDLYFISLSAIFLSASSACRRAKPIGSGGCRFRPEPTRRGLLPRRFTEMSNSKLPYLYVLRDRTGNRFPPPAARMPENNLGGIEFPDGCRSASYGSAGRFAAGPGCHRQKISLSHSKSYANQLRISHNYQ